MKLWADLRAVPPPEILSALSKCEICAASPVDAILITGSPPTPLPRELIFASPTTDSPSSNLLDATGRTLGIRVASDADGQKAPISAVGSAEWIHLDASGSDWTMIPSENLLSACDGTPTRVAVTASSADAVPGLAFALQMGVGALVIPPPADAEGEALWEAAAIARAQRAELPEEEPGEGATGEEELAVGVVTSVEPGGLGDRVALDFTRLLREGEGALLGS